MIELKNGRPFGVKIQVLLTVGLATRLDRAVQLPYIEWYRGTNEQNIKRSPEVRKNVD